MYDIYDDMKVGWDCTGNYLLSNSESDYNIYVFSLGSGSIVQTLPGEPDSGKGHRGQIRDIATHRHRREFITASFDHSIIQWGNTES